MNSATPTPKLAWTGERMVPFESDPITEFFHWQRYLYFRPWYQDANIIDAASGEGYGTNYASLFSASSLGVDLSKEAIDHSASSYPSAEFRCADACAVDYSAADLVLSFETIEHLPDPDALLKAMSTCKGRVVISTPNRLNHSPGNRLEDQPLNEFHTVEWTPTEFAELIQSHFSGRQIRFLSQENRFPGLIREGLSDDAKYVIAVIGDGELPVWPKVGISVPTCNGPQRLQEAIFNFARFYPGEVEFAVVANGSTERTLEDLRKMRDAWPHMVHLIVSRDNLGYGQGANLGLRHLMCDPECEIFGVSNDDVIPSLDCLSIMVESLRQLQKQGLKPGCVGPLSNSVNGSQSVNIGPFTNYREMMELANRHRQKHHSELRQSVQVRGLFFIAPRVCLEEVGGFDPIFGLGNFEDDDWNVRVRMSGFSLWIAEGAFLYHSGSATFNELQLDYSKNIERNLKLFTEKWAVSTHAEAFEIDHTRSAIQPYIPLDALSRNSGHTMNFGREQVDLVWQATETEFAAAVMLMVKDSPRIQRQIVLDLLAPKTSSRCAA